MSEFHLAYFSLGSNIEPEANLPKSMKLLSGYGEILKVSSVWESAPVGTTGPNYLNLCILFKAIYTRDEMMHKIIHPIEAELGRERGEDKYAARSIDIDVIIFDDKSVAKDWHTLAYVVVPLAEIYPEFQNPVTKEKIIETATRLRREVWLETRRGVLG